MLVKEWESPDFSLKKILCLALCVLTQLNMMSSKWKKAALRQKLAESLTIVS